MESLYNKIKPKWKFNEGEIPTLGKRKSSKSKLSLDSYKRQKSLKDVEPAEKVLELMVRDFVTPEDDFRRFEQNEERDEDDLLSEEI